MKQEIYILDTGLASVGDSSVIDGYTQINSGNQLLVYANDVGMSIGKANTADPSIGKHDANYYYEEGVVSHNSVANRSFSLSGSLDVKQTTHKTQVANLIKLIRSPAVFGFKNEITKWDDNPNSSATVVGQSEFTAGTYVYVTFINLELVCSADDKNIIDWTMDVVFTK
jgi:hypothetical protein